MDRAGKAEVEREVERLSRTFEDHYNACDAEGLVAAYFAEEVEAPLACPPGGIPPVRGRTAAMIPAAPRIRLRRMDLVAGDRVAYELGRAELRFADGTAGVGRYTVCWILTPVGWRAKIDFFAEDGWPD